MKVSERESRSTGFVRKRPYVCSLVEEEIIYLNKFLTGEKIIIILLVKKIRQTYISTGESDRNINSRL